MGQIATIPAGVPFAETLAEAMLRRHGSDGDNRLGDAVLYLPTRRAVRTLTQAFLRASDGAALILPRLIPIGDVDEDELLAPSGSAGDEADLAPAIPAFERQFLLARLIERSGTAPDTASALALARALANLIDEAATERLSFNGLVALAPEQFQAHWQITLDFLAIVTSAWPGILSERGLLDPATRRDRLAALQAGHWRQGGAPGPVWIAGSTGSIPGTADLIQAALTLADGMVVLPGFATDLGERDRRAAREEPAHPQHGMLTLLRALGQSPDDVIILGDESTARPRAVLMQEVLRSAATTEAWQDLSHIPDGAVQGMRMLVAQSPRDEAAAIAIRLRQALETPGKTAALVTPDRDLARRVVGEMRRFGIEIDDSAGQPLRLTRVGVFLQLAATTLGGGLAPADLLALLKHPLAAAGKAPPDFRREVRQLERSQMRGLRRYDILSDLAHRAESHPRRSLTLPWLHELDSRARAFAEAADFESRLRAQLEFCEWLAASDDEPGAARLWRGEDGTVAAQAMADLLASAPDAPAVDIAGWSIAMDGLIGGLPVRPRFGLHPRLAVLGPLEARLQRFDLTILGGLNEGVWPTAPTRDPWMSRGMRASFGLPAPERRAGLQAHDFAQLAAGHEVILSRSVKTAGAPTVPSRWLLRLASVAAGRGLKLVQDEDAPIWSRALDRRDHPRAVAAPAPCPPAEARPPTLPVTAVETLIRDPYAIFARRILKLRPLDPIDDPPGPALKGNILHKAFEVLARRHPGRWTPALWPELQEIGREVLAAEGLPAAALSLWTRRFEGAGHWLLTEEARREDGLVHRYVEHEGKATDLPGLDGFTLTAKADRLDQLSNGTILIADYKTGNAPSPKQIAAQFAVQLPLTALILERGGFEEIGKAELAGLVHILVHGAREGGEWKPVKIKNMREMLDKVADEVLALIASFREAETPYRSRPHVQFQKGYYAEYDHLARVAEWSVVGDGGGDES